MDLYLYERSPSRHSHGSFVELYDLVRSRRSLGSERTSVVKYAIVILILGALALKIYSLIVLFARMNVVANVLINNHGEEQRIQIFSDFISDFSFPEMVRDFWHARAYMVSTVIVLGSSVFPIAKNLFLLFAWLTPITSEWEPMRRSFLFIFDQFGRTAFVDLYLSGYVFVIFYTDVIQAYDLYGIEIKLSGQPVRGIFAGITSAVISEFLSHFLLLVHDEQSMGEFHDQVTVAAGPAVASLNQRLYASPVSLFYKRVFSFSIAFLLVSSAITFALLLNGSYEIVSFHLEGVAGAIASEGWRQFNLLTAPKKMPEMSDEITGTKILAALHVIFVLLIPLITWICACICSKTSFKFLNVISTTRLLKWGSMIDAKSLTIR